MANWFTYLIKTPIAQICADYDEYKQLGRDVHYAKAKRDAAHDNLIYVYCEESAGVFARPDSCITHIFPELPNVERPLKEVCKAYMPGVPCPKKNCDCQARNHKHCLAAEAYADKLNEYKKFWENKFNQKKQ